MLLIRSTQSVVARTPAKVNLFLEVLGKRPDGYHDLATLMVTVSLYDTLEFKEDRSQEISLDIVSQKTSARLSTGPENLICRAAELLRQRTGYGRGVRIRLHKRIPLEAGLAGGSSDAAATLLGLNRLWRLGRSREELASWGAELGSDVAFFFWSPAAWCTGRGENVAPVSLGKPLWLVLVCPAVGLSTASVFRALSVPEHPIDGTALREAVARGNIEEVGRRLHNRLQPCAERLCPLLPNLDHRLGQTGPAGHLMSGSGTTLFALCRDHGEAVRVANHLVPSLPEASAFRVYIVRSSL